MNQSVVPLPAENVFGHTAKLRFFTETLDRLRAKRDRGLKTLDLGCGSGWAVTRHLWREGDQVLGVDMYAPNIDYARRHFAHDGLEFRCSDVRTLQSETPAWDVIVLADVLEHLDNPDELLASCRDLLSQDGRLLVSLPNGFGPFEIESGVARFPLIGRLLLRATDMLVAILNKFLLRGVWTRLMAEAPPDLPYNDESPHVQFRGYRNWTELLARAGFRATRVRNLAFLCGPFSNYLVGPSRRWCRANVRIARRLPKSMVSNWAFECEVHGYTRGSDAARG